MTRFLLIAAALFVAYKVFGGMFGVGEPDLPSNITPVQSVPAAQRKNVLLFTGTEWCPACKILERSVVGTDPWREFTGKEVLFTAYDIPRDSSRITGPAAIALRRYQVSAFPTMFVVDPQGNIVSKKVGVMGDVEDYKRWIRGL